MNIFDLRRLADRCEIGAVGIHHADPPMRLPILAETAIRLLLGLQNRCSKLPPCVILRTSRPRQARRAIRHNRLPSALGATRP
jgi:hypothetical protein